MTSDRRRPLCPTQAEGAIPPLAEILSAFPLAPSATVQSLSGEQRDLLRRYVLDATGGSPLARVLDALEERHPGLLRIKELFETLEAGRRIGPAVYERWRAGQVKAILDLACGHGLLGLLLAGRFPNTPVTCVDRKRRPLFDHFLEAADALGIPLMRVTFAEGDLRDVAVPPGSYVTCVHGCNDVTRVVLEKAAAAGAGWAVMPCCLRDDIHGCALRNLDDRTRYAVAVGVLAGRWGARKVVAIDAAITPKNLLLLGDAGA